jgi:hypothetical protein
MNWNKTSENERYVMAATEIRSKYHNIVVELKGWDEPNNGRMLHIADIFVNGILENNRYFDDWNRLDAKLDQLTFDSPDGAYVYVPAESGGFLINTSSFEKIKLPYKPISTVTFLGNYFRNSILIVTYTDEITLFNTMNGITSKVSFPANNVVWSEIDSSNNLFVSHTDGTTKAYKIGQFT